MEQYKKEIERAKRFESQKGTGVSQGTGQDGRIVVKKKVVANGSIKRPAGQQIRQ
jgi:hypothetical protein